jgi:uncharacterized protein
LIFREIKLDDQPLFKGIEYISSDYLFSYLYMFSEIYKLKIYSDDKTIIIQSGAGTCKSSFYMPLGDVEHGVNKVLEYCSDSKIKPVFTRIPNNYIDLFQGFSFTVKEDRNTFDYIFRNSDLANYEGKDYRKQRNNLSNYFKTAAPIFTLDIKDHIEECKAFTLNHYKKVDVINPTLKLLDNIKYFYCQGGIVWDQGVMQAFCIYEKVSQNTVLSHVELTSPVHRGVHAYMINEMSKNINEEYINKEDDLGLLGLRRFKESYYPCDMIVKSTAYRE